MMFTEAVWSIATLCGVAGGACPVLVWAGDRTTCPRLVDVVSLLRSRDSSGAEASGTGLFAQAACRCRGARIPSPCSRCPVRHSRNRARRTEQLLPPSSFSGVTGQCDNTDIALRHRLDIVEVRSARARQAIGLRQHDLGRDTANRGTDGCNGDRVQHCDRGVACQDEHWSPFVGIFGRVPAHIAAIHEVPQSCSPSQVSNSPGMTGLAA
jgi:hypothetical protein